MGPEEIKADYIDLYQLHCEKDQRIFWKKRLYNK